LERQDRKGMAKRPVQDAKKQKSNQRFTIKMQKKLLVLFGLVLLAFIGLSARLLWISREKGEKYGRQVLSQQKYDSITLPFRRGDIVDCNGSSLAVSEKVYNLVIDSYVMTSRETYLEPNPFPLSNRGKKPPQTGKGGS